MQRTLSRHAFLAIVALVVAFPFMRASAQLVGTEISYQGHLLQNGVPLNGIVDMDFTLFTAEVGGVQVGTTVSLTGVEVDAGVFTVDLDFGVGIFEGSARWLEITVNTTLLQPRQKIRAAPYALSLRPEAVVFGTTNGPAAFTVVRANPVGGGFGILGENKAEDGSGVTGFSSAADGIGAGVIGQSNSPIGIGVKGTNGGTTGSHRGVLGQVVSPDGVGVEGSTLSNTGSTIGVFGLTNSPDGLGVKGVNNAPGGGTGIGVEGRSSAGFGAGVHGVHGLASGQSPAPGAGLWGNSTDAHGVLGTSANFRGVSGIGATIGVGGWSFNANGTGTLGFNLAGSGSGIGVHGKNDSTAGYGGYFENTSSDGIALFAESNGFARSKATLRVNNTRASGGIAAYMTADSTFSTAHVFNGGSGEVFYLQNGGVDSAGTGGGDFIQCRNEPETDIQFRVLSSGEARSDVGFFTPAADFAEMLHSDDASLEPGEVLVIGPDGSMQRSTTPYQDTVIGVYSTQPGFGAGMPVDGPAPGTIPVAMVGVVPVKATSENGSIRPGDMLVASSTPGRAMRAGDRRPNGAIIGKALGGLSQREGTIRMVVILQ